MGKHRKASAKSCAFSLAAQEGKPARIKRVASKRQRESLFLLYRGRCAICGNDLDPDNFEVDHLIPFSKGGKTVISNLQPLCKTCHGGKSREARSIGLLKP